MHCGMLEQLTSALCGIATYLDKIQVSEANAKEHLQNLYALLQSLKDKNLHGTLTSVL